jgi:MerR family transcriptional regulator, copper efflux regulator
VIFIGKSYRIGELAKESNLSKRTVDYYTKLGLIECSRSENGYRNYDETTIEKLKIIEQCQQVHMPLVEIKERLTMMVDENVDIQVFEKQVDRVKNEMEHLSSELNEILQIVNSLKDDDKKQVLSRVSPQAMALVQSLLVFSV